MKRMRPQEMSRVHAAPRRLGHRMVIYSLLYPDTLIPNISLTRHYEPKFGIEPAPLCATARIEAILKQKFRNSMPLLFL